MTNQEIIDSLKASDLRNVQNVQALFDMARNTGDMALCKYAREKAQTLAEEGSPEGYELVRETYLWAAQNGDFDSYCIYLEWNRKPEERFYLPRRKQLLNAINVVQELLDDKLDEAFLSQPPRTGKTTILMFLMSYIIGLNSELSNLYCAYSDAITQSFYSGVLEIINDQHTYLWHDIFPAQKLVATNAKMETINIDRNKRYASLTCRSLYGTLNGSCDCRGFLVSDDLIGGIEEALNRDRLDGAWSKVTNNLLSRVSGRKAKHLWWGTRWSLFDPIGRRINMLENDKAFGKVRYRVLSMPALDENDESNFEYLYGKGFTTRQYHEMRATFENCDDIPSWLAQFMQTPVERQGTVFPAGEFRYYNGVLPDGQPDRIFMAVDPAWGGGDYVAAPICYKFGDDIYVADVIYSDGPKTVTQPMIFNKAIKHNVAAIQIEATKMTEEYAQGVDKLLRGAGRRINMTVKSASLSAMGKQQRIFDKRTDIKERMIFLQNGQRSKEYQLFMQSVFSFKVIGKNKHDDAPDSLCMAIAMDSSTGAKAQIIDRLW